MLISLTEVKFCSFFAVSWEGEELNRESPKLEGGMAPSPMSDTKMNAIRSGIVVLGALAFGYLSIQIGFKPFLEKAQQQRHALHQSDSDPSPPSQESAFPERDS